MTAPGAPGTGRAGVLGRDAGPLGRAVRVAAGAAALTQIVTTKAHGHSGGELLAAAATALGLAVAYTAALALMRPLLTRGARGGLSGWPGAALLLLPMLLYPIGVLPDGPAIGVALYTETSVLLAGLSGYGGLELVALPVLLLGRRPVLYSPFNAVDLAERGMRRRWHATPERWGGALAVAGLAWFWVEPGLAAIRGGFGDAVGTLNVLDPVASGALLLAGVLLAVPAPGPARLRRLRAAAFALLGLGGVVGAVPDVLWPVIILTGLVTGAVRAASRRGRSAPAPAAGVLARPHVETSSTAR
ncbi:DUF6410 domain-containing protein [Streptomyces sp. NPDC049915]|uniref:DUF6410 domain-containing protein n=1 Tax=Streptomyces sp. NPDC049915 TaxID=3155510 RepID=UPI003449ED3F